MTYVDDVREFMNAAGQRIPDKPTVLEGADLWLRMTMLTEEFSELKRGLSNLKKANSVGNTTGVEDGLVEVGDAITDMIFVLIGTALAYGLNPDAMWDEVSRSNRTKINPATGKMGLDSTGKVIKGGSYSPPNLRKAIYGRSH